MLDPDARSGRRCALLRDLRAHRLGFGHGSSFREEDCYSRGARERRTQGRAGLGGALPLARAGRAAQPALRRRLRLRAGREREQPAAGGIDEMLPRDQWLALSGALTPATSPGSSSSRTWLGSARTPRQTAPSAPRARRAKGRRCFRAWRFAAMRRADDGPLYVRHGQKVPEYVCQKEAIKEGAPLASVLGAGNRPGHRRAPCRDRYADDAGGRSCRPRRARARADEADALRQQQVERARHEADLARRRFMDADPGNRLVVVLEADWNDKLRPPSEAQEEYTRGARPTGTCSRRDSRNRSSRWPPTSRDCGTTRARAGAQAHGAPAARGRHAD